MDKHQFHFHGNGGEFFKIWIVNIVLSILTLGIYSAWAKVRTKRYFYGNLALDGDRFDYLAQPKQILIGRIIAVIAFAIWMMAAQYSPLMYFVLLLVFIGIFPIIAVRNIRFDMQMTQYRNVRFSFTDDYVEAYSVLVAKPFKYYMMLLGGLILVGFMASSGKIAGGVASFLFLISLPFVFAKINANIGNFIVNGTQFGNLPFKADLDSEHYFKIYLMAGGLSFCVSLAFTLLMIPVAALGGFLGEFNESVFDNQMIVSVIGVVVYLVMIILSLMFKAFIKARVRNYVFSETKVGDDLQLESTLSTPGYMMLTATNMLLMIVTAGFARPYVMVRHARFMADATAVEGDLSLTTVSAGPEDPDNAVADEMTDIFDIEIAVV